MAVITQHLDASPAALFAVLLDPRRYPDWVVGCKDIRAVDADWPAPGSRFHHRVGLFGPLTVADSTVVEEVDPPRSLVLRARARPAGVARVSLHLEAADGGTDVRMTEVPISGPAKHLHNPLLDGLIALRNRRSLSRLEELARAGSRT